MAALLDIDPTGSGVLTLAATFMLVSWWKALLVFPPLLAWGWLVSSVFDKHAERFFLGRQKWAMIHMAFAVVAVVAVFAMPLPTAWGFFVGYAVYLVLLALDVVLFAVITNRDDNVPEKHKLTLNFSAIAEASKAKKDAKSQAHVSLTLRKPDGHDLSAPKKDDPEFEVRVAAEDLFNKAQEIRAAQVDVVPLKDGNYQASFIVDGVRQPGDKLAAQQAVAVIDLWKKAAGLDTDDRRRKLVGRAMVIKHEVKTPVRVSSQGSSGGMRLNLTIDPEGAVSKQFEQLGLLDGQEKTFNAIMARPGVVLLASPPRNGRTTSLYAFIRQHDAYTQNVQTFEVEPLAAIEGVRQTKFNPDAGAEFSTNVRSILRRDPDVLAVSEMPDVETAKEIARVDSDRTKVYLSLNADSALAAIQLYAKAVGSGAEASKGLSGVVAQKLVRRLCENCKVGYTPTPDMLKKLGLPADAVKQLYKKGGQVLIRNKPDVCPVCKGVGYLDQIGAFEVYEIGAEEKKAIKEESWSALRAALRKQKTLPLQQAALRRALEGVTSVEEVMRISSSGKPKAPEAKPAATA